MRSPPSWLAVSVVIVSACGSSSTRQAAADAQGRADAGSDSTSAEVGGPDGDGSDRIEASGSGADAASDPTPETTQTPDAGDAAPPPASGSPWRALSIATGLIHNCALLDNHQVKCWGSNASGALGYGEKGSRGASADMGDALPFVDLGTGRTATAIAAGRYVTCAILDDGSVKCWGRRLMLGMPTTTPQGDLGDDPGEMGDALPALELGPGRKATQIACGYLISCAVLDDDSVRCWGDDVQRLPTPVPLPSQTKVRQLAPAMMGVMAVLDDGRVVGLLPSNVPGIVLPAGRKATFAAGATSGACALVDGEAVACNDLMDWVPPPTVTDLVAIGLSVVRPFSCGLSSSGDVRCWGFSSCQYPGGTIYWCPDPPLADRSHAVALGGKAVAIGTGGLLHTCALLADGGVKCWSSSSTCPTPEGGALPCPVPPIPEATVLASSVEIIDTGGARRYGAWRAIDLGRRP